MRMSKKMQKRNARTRACDAHSATSPRQPECARKHADATSTHAAAACHLQCEEVQFVDVREPGEYELARLPHFKLMPLSEASSWAPTVDDDLDPAAETVVLCHHGVRSMQAAAVRCSPAARGVHAAVYARQTAAVPRPTCCAAPNLLHAVCVCRLQPCTVPGVARLQQCEECHGRHRCVQPDRPPHPRVLTSPAAPAL